MDTPGWLEKRLEVAIDRMLAEKGVACGAREAEARAHRLAELKLDPFASLWRDVAAELRRRIEHGFDA
jgi:hypothetical protein